MEHILKMLWMEHILKMMMYLLFWRMDQLNGFIPAGTFVFIIVALNMETRVGSVMGDDFCKVHNFKIPIQITYIRLPFITLTSLFF